MSELETLRAAAPQVEPISDAEAARVRARLGRTSRRPAPRLRRTGLLAAPVAVVAALAVAFVALSAESGDSNGAAWGAEAVRMAEASPLLLLRQDGWQVTRVDEWDGEHGEMTFARQGRTFERALGAARRRRRHGRQGRRAPPPPRRCSAPRRGCPLSRQQRVRRELERRPARGAGPWPGSQPRCLRGAAAGPPQGGRRHLAARSAGQRRGAGSAQRRRRRHARRPPASASASTSTRCAAAAARATATRSARRSPARWPAAGSPAGSTPRRRATWPRPSAPRPRSRRPASGRSCARWTPTARIPRCSGSTRHGQRRADPGTTTRSRRQGEARRRGHGQAGRQRHEPGDGRRGRRGQDGCPGRQRQARHDRRRHVQGGAGLRRVRSGGGAGSRPLPAPPW